jgi:hypothetical protein
MIITGNELRRHFCEYVRAWKIDGKLELDIELRGGAAVYANKVFDELAQADDAVPAAIATMLDLPIGSSYADAVVVMNKAWDEPRLPTPEEEAEAEMFALKLSECVERFNARHPELPQLSVEYPKVTRRRQ